LKYGGNRKKNVKKLKKNSTKVFKSSKKVQKKQKIEKKDAKKSAFKHVSSACLTGGGRPKIWDRRKFQSQNESG